MSNPNEEFSDYSEVELACQGCFGPCGLCEELAPTANLPVPSPGDPALADELCNCGYILPSRGHYDPVHHKPECAYRVAVDARRRERLQVAA